MKRGVLLLILGLALALSTALLVRAAQPAPTIRTYESGSHETQYVIPPRGTPYCFSPSADLPPDLAACPKVNWNGAVPPDPNVGPVPVTAKP